MRSHCLALSLSCDFMFKGGRIECALMYSRGVVAIASLAYALMALAIAVQAIGPMGGHCGELIRHPWPCGVFADVFALPRGARHEPGWVIARAGRWCIRVARLCALWSVG